MTPRLLFRLMAFSLLSLLGLQAAPLQPGADAPKLTGRTDKGGEIRLEDVYAANTYTLIFFYPKASTSGCTAQGCSLRDANAELSRLGVAILGVSTDDEGNQRAFSEKNRFPFPLIADTDKKWAQGFGISVTLGMAKRSAFLIKGGKIVWMDPNAATGKQAEDVLKAIAAIEGAKPAGAAK